MKYLFVKSDKSDKRYADAESAESIFGCVHFYTDRIHDLIPKNLFYFYVVRRTPVPSYIHPSVTLKIPGHKLQTQTHILNALERIILR